MAETKYLTVPHLDTKTLARIFSKIEVNRASGCWNWTASTRNGYGQIFFGLDNRPVYAHRLLYAWLVGPIPRSRARGVPVLDHAICDNARCCNPAHLALVSQRENVTRGPKSFGGRTICKNGHPLPSAGKDGRRRCLVCARAHNRAWVTSAGETFRLHQLKYLREYRKRVRCLHTSTTEGDP